MRTMAMAMTLLGALVASAPQGSAPPVDAGPPQPAPPDAGPDAGSQTFWGTLPLKDTGLSGCFALGGKPKYLRRRARPKAICRFEFD